MPLPITCAERSTVSCLLEPCTDKALAYQFGPCVVSTDLRLDALPHFELETGLACIQATSSAAPFTVDPHWLHHWIDDDEVVLSMARQGPDYFLRFPDLADFLLEPDASRITVVHRNVDTDDATLEHLLIDQVLPRYLAHEGLLSLHASALTIDGKCLLILGKSGAGKSTLAGFLAAHGHGLLSDDCTIVEVEAGRALATATYPSLRLLPDSVDALYPAGADLRPMAHYSPKQRVAAQQAGDGRLPTLAVDGLVVLEVAEPASDDVALAPMTAAETCLALVRHSFQLDPGDKPRMAAHLRRCSGIARMLPAFRLHYPRRYDRAPEAVAAIEAHVAALPAPPITHVPDPGP